MILLSFLSLGLAAPEIPSTQKPTDQPNTYVDWTKAKLITVVHNQDQVGQWNDERRQEQAALHTAEDQLMASYPYISISDRLTISSFQQENPSGVIIGTPSWSIDETIYYDEGGVEVIASIDLLETLNPIIGHLSSSDISAQTPQTHSGLIIDARGLNFEPILLPVIYDSDGNPLIHISALAKETADRRLPVRYSPDPAHPLIIRQVGKNAAVVRAVSATQTGLVVHPEDMKKMPSEKDVSAIASAGLLAIIIDQ
jgi:hypothetical protein